VATYDTLFRSKRLWRSQKPRDADCLRQAVLYVRTNMSQGLWFGEGNNNVFGRTLNPFNVGPHASSSPSLPFPCPPYLLPRSSTSCLMGLSTACAVAEIPSATSHAEVAAAAKAHSSACEARSSAWAATSADRSEFR
jgi:hypothetical protein